MHTSTWNNKNVFKQRFTHKKKQKFWNSWNVVIVLTFIHFKCSSLFLVFFFSYWMEVNVRNPTHVNDLKHFRRTWILYLPFSLFASHRMVFRASSQWKNLNENTGKLHLWQLSFVILFIKKKKIMKDWFHCVVQYIKRNILFV